MDTTSTGQVRRWDAAQEALAAPVLTGRALSIDVEKARAVLARLERLANSVSDLHSRLGFRRTLAAGSDDVSTNVAEQCDRMLIVARAYLIRWSDDICDGAGALRRQIDEYESGDRRNVARA